MKKILLVNLLVTALAAFGCSEDRIDCMDSDGDGYGNGQDCTGWDCNDGDAACHEGACCSACTDADGDGYGVGTDCDGPDCNDGDAACHEGDCCGDCTDQDGDGYG